MEDMDVWQVEFYLDARERAPVLEWLDSLSKQDAALVWARLARVRMGNFGDWKGLGKGLEELRLRQGAGLRIYYRRLDRKIILLLAGGNKKSQSKDIRLARRRWKSYMERSE